MKRIFLYLLCGWCLFVLNPVWAGSSWQSASYSHFSKDEPLEGVLADFSSAVGIPVTLSNRLKANASLKVNGSFKGLNAVQFLNRLNGLYQLTWYFDGSSIYIYQNNEVKSELLHFDNTEVATVKKMLINLRVWDSRFNWKSIPDRNLLFVSGPPRYIELVKEVAGLVDKNRGTKGEDKYEVRVLQLKYAWADDRRIKFREQYRVVPGIATTIKNILTGGSQVKINKNADKSQASAADLTSPSSTTNSTNPTLDKLQSELSKKEPDHGGPSDKQNATHSSESSTSFAYVEANSQRNAIVVYDLASRMPLYEQLIAALDVPTEQVEIEVSIVDVNTDHLADLGFDWKSQSKNLEFSFGDLNSITSSTVLGSTNYFISRLRLLQSSGDSQFISKPSVITLNNIEAIIDNSTTFYAKLQGERAVDLVPIHAGSVLRVTPRIIRDNNKTFVSIDVNIEDGQISTDAKTRTDGLPQVSNSTVTTQAIIGENNSLLIGGYYRDSSKKSENKIPFLSDIPFIKHIATSSTKSRTKVARLFMITPRIVENITAESAANKIHDDLVTRENFDAKNTKYQAPRFHVFDDKKKSAEGGLDIYD